MAGRAIGILLSWEGTGNPFLGFPAWHRLIAPLPRSRWRAELAKPEVRAAFLAEQPVDLGEFANFVTRSFGKMFPSTSGPVDYEPGPEHSVAAIAAATGKRPEEIAYDALNANDGRGILYFPLFNYSDGDLELLHELHQHPRTRMGLSDGGAHCGAICDGGMPTFMVSWWTRDRSRGPRLGLEHVVMRQTSQSARLFGLNDRGLLRPGYRADVNVIDYDRLAPGRPEIAYDLPAGGKRYVQRATGYEHTICRGTTTFRNGESTGALPGRLVRGPQAAPA